MVYTEPNQAGWDAAMENFLLSGFNSLVAYLLGSLAAN